MSLEVIKLIIFEKCKIKILDKGGVNCDCISYDSFQT